jgi:hypothetical protein
MILSNFQGPPQEPKPQQRPKERTSSQVFEEVEVAREAKE